VSKAPLADRSHQPNDSSPRLRLPLPLAPLIGREREITQLRQILHRPEVRLVTITGPGGVGKTSLALQVAHELGNSFPDSIYFISLAAIRDPTLIIPTIAQALGLAESPNRLLFDSLKEYLRERRMLLLIDNFEQVVSAAPLLTELLSVAGQLKLLVTSREALRLRGEREFPLAPLELSDRAQMPHILPAEALLRYSSIALFVQRARASQPDFQLTEDNATAVAEICARLDGLPLAIELAAARIKLLPPEAMLARLQESSLSLLTAGARDAPARQKTLRDTLQWSYDLLDADEKQAFRWLSVFAGGCTLEAAIKVIGHQSAVISGREQETDHGSPVTLDDIASLVNKSLLRQAKTDGEPRLSMLETLREFGLEQLAHEDELEAAQRDHAEYYLSLAEEAEQHLAGKEQKAWLGRLEREQDNFRVVLRWGHEFREAEFVLRLAGALAPFWFLRGQWSEGRRWLEAAISVSAHATADKALHARVLHVGVPMMIYQGDVARARLLSERSIALYRELDDKEGLLAALLQLCRALDYQEEYERLQEQALEALALAESLPDLPVKAQAYTELFGRFVYFGGASPVEAAFRLLEESMRIYRALDDPVGLANALFFYGVVWEQQGDEERAQILHEEAERLLAEIEDHRLRMVIFSHCMISNWQKGNYAAARRSFEQLLAHRTSAALSKVQLEILAAILHGQGLSLWAARVYGLADRSAGVGPRKRVIEHVRAPLAAARAAVRARLGDAAFDKAFNEGRSLTADDLLAIPHPIPPGSKSPPSGASPFEPLTGRETEVLRLLAQELSNPQIAERLVVSRRTVDAHLRAIYAKLGVRSRDAAIRVAREYGLIEK
jgi:predicted ATPase/DNA-binding CsgD family transcriptional regulator